MIFLNSDNCFQITGLQDAITGAYINNASITGIVALLDGTTLETMDGSYVSASNGDYICILTAAQTSSLVALTEYVITLTATTGSLQRVFCQNHTAFIGGFID